MNRNLLATLLNRGRLLPALLVALAIAGCATGPAPSFRQNTSGTHLQWPPAPEAARVEWVKEVNNHGDVGIAKTFWKRVAEFFSGAQEAGIDKPYGVFADDKERLFVVDVSRAVIHLFDMRRRTAETIGEGGAFTTPIAIAEDDADVIYVTDSAGRAVIRYNLQDKTFRPFTPFKIGRPTGIAFNRKNRLLYISDTAEHVIRVFSLDGNERFHFGGRGEGAGQFNFPTDLFIDGGGNVYVTDSLNSRIQIFSADGKFQTMFGEAGDTTGNLARPKGVAVDSDGHIYVCDALADSVQIFDRSGKLLLLFGGNGSDAGRFWMPAGLHIDRDDYIYVSDTYNHRIQIFRYLKEEPPAPPSGGKKAGAEADYLNDQSPVKK